MQEPLRYGVFQVGRTWRVVSHDQVELGFSDRSDAMAAIDLIRSSHRLAGETCEVFMVDDTGKMFRLPN